MPKARFIGRPSYAIALACACFASTSSAAIRTYYFEGNVVNPAPPFGTLQAGDHFTGTFAFDDDPVANPDRRPQPFNNHTGYYDWTNFQIEGRSLTGSADILNNPNLTVLDDFNLGGSLVDGIVVKGTYQSATYFVTFYDSTQTAFSSDQLDPIGASLADSTYTSMAIRNSNLPNGSTTFGTITRLSNQPIPEPQSALLLVTACLTSRWRRRRRRNPLPPDGGEATTRE